MTGEERPAGGAAGVAMAVLAAIVEGRVADVLALTDPGVVCLPVTRPGRSVYEGHAGMAVLVRDLRAVWGRYRVKAEEAGGGARPDGAGGERVRLRLLVAETEAGDMAVAPVLTEFTVRDGLVTRIDSTPED